LVGAAAARRTPHFGRHGFVAQARKLACVHVSCSLVTQSTQRKADASSHEDDGPYARVSAHDDALVIANSVTQVA
jgi:hypothetical protein